MSYMDKARLDKGYILILPGIEGESKLNHWIADGPEGCRRARCHRHLRLDRLRDS